MRQFAMMNGANLYFAIYRNEYLFQKLSRSICESNDEASNGGAYITHLFIINQVIGGAYNPVIYD